MSELNITLSQIEKSDLPVISRLIKGFADFFDIEKDFYDSSLEKWFHSEGVKFCIRAQRKGDDKNYVVGLAWLKDIKWVSRHACLRFCMVDEGGYSACIQNSKKTKEALDKVVEYAFDVLGLNKLWVSVLDGSQSGETLIAKGFQLEGIKREEVFKNGKYMDVKVYSLLRAQ